MALTQEQQNIDLLAKQVAGDIKRIDATGPVNLKHPRFGAIGDGVADDTVAVQAALNFCASNAATLFIPAGCYKITNPLTVTLNNNNGTLITGGRRASIIGSAFSNSMLMYSGTKDKPALSISGTYDDQLNIDGLNILRADAGQIGIGLYVEKQVNFTYKNIRCSYFDIGFKGANINEGLLQSVVCDWNKTGLYFTSGDINPNANVFIGCAFNSNSTYGAFIENGCSNTFTGCRFLGNGTTAAGAAIRIIYNGSNGRVMLTTNGNYVENNGKYSIWISAADGGSIVLNGDSFHKMTTGQYATNHLFVEPVNLTAANNPAIKVCLNGFSTSILQNVAKPAEQYVADASRPDVLLSPGPNGYDGYEVIDNGVYQSSVERPNLIPGQKAIGFDANGVLDLKRTPVNFIYVTNNSGTLKALKNGSIGQMLTLQFDNAITIEHNAGMILKNAQSVTLSGGQTITLYKQSANQYREICRQ